MDQIQLTPSQQRISYHAVYIPPALAAHLTPLPGGCPRSDDVNGDVANNDGQSAAPAARSSDPCTSTTELRSLTFPTDGEAAEYYQTAVALALSQFPDDHDDGPGDWAARVARIDSMILDDLGDAERFCEGAFTSQGPFYAVHADPSWRGLVDASGSSSADAAPNATPTPGVYGTSQAAERAAKKLKKAAARFIKCASYAEARHFVEFGEVFLSGGSAVESDNGSTMTSTSTASDGSGAVDGRVAKKGDGEHTDVKLGIDAPPLPFQAPSRGELMTLKKALEGKKLDSAKEIVQRNPLYLINARGDVPTLLMEGPRYNAMHVAARAGFAEGCQIILDFVSDPFYIRSLYQDDSDKLAADRCVHLQTAYLNMPDKANNRSPIHWAAKLGHVDVTRTLCGSPLCNKNIKDKSGDTALHIAVAAGHLPIIRLLCSYPDVTRDIPNADGQTPFDLISDNSYGTKSPKVKKDIQATLAESLVYIALYRDFELSRSRIHPPSLESDPLGAGLSGVKAQSADHVTKDPFKLRRLDSCDDRGGRMGVADDASVPTEVELRIEGEKLCGRTPGSTGIRGFAEAFPRSVDFPGSAGCVGPSPGVTFVQPFLAAVVGPCSHEIGDEIYRAWASNRSQKAQAAKRTDPHKGIERHGRALAKEHGVPWKEYWSFLDSLVDVSSSEGLDKFESYLKSKRNCLKDSTPPVDENAMPGASDVILRCATQSGPDSSSLNRLTELLDPHSKYRGKMLSRQQDLHSPRIAASPYSPLNPHFKSRLGPGGRLMTRRQLVNEIPSGDSADEARSKPEPLPMDNGGGSGATTDVTPTMPGASELASKVSAGVAVADDRGTGVGQTNEMADDDIFYDACCDEDVGESRGDAAGLDDSFCLSEVSSTGTVTDLAEDAAAGISIFDEARNDTGFVTPPDSPGDTVCYILGLTPSKLDVDVLEALDPNHSANVDPFKYPSVSAWYHAMRFYADSERRLWPSLDSPRFVPRIGARCRVR